MWKFLYKPVLGIIAKRKELIENDFSTADTAKKEAQQLKTEYESKLAGAQQECQQKLSEAKEQMQSEYDRVVADANAKASQIVADAKKAGEEERDKTVKEAQGQIASLAMAAAAKIVLQSQGEQADKAAYDAFLAKADNDRKSGQGY